MRRLNLISAAQFCHQAVKAAGEIVDVKVERIVVAIGDLRIDRGMECRDEPSVGAHAGDDVEECKPVILRGGKRWIGRARIVAPAAAWSAAARLNHFVVQEQPLQRAAEFRRLLELGLTPGDRIIVRQQKLAGPADDDKGFAPAVMALEVSQVVDLAAAVDVAREGTAAEIRSTGVVDYKIARHRRGKVIVVGARYRQPEKIAELTLEPQEREVIVQRGA